LRQAEFLEHARKDGFRLLDNRSPPPGFDLALELLVEALEPLSGLGHRPALLLEDDLLRRGRTDHCPAPTPMGRTPGGPTCRAKIVAKQERCETPPGGLKSASGVFTGAAQVTAGFVLALRDIDGCELARPQQAGSWSGLSTSRFNPVARRLGNQGGGDHPAGVPFLAQVAREPRAAGAGLRDADKPLASRL